MSKVAQIETESDETRTANQLPDPTGYKILIALPGPDKEFEGGILKANKTLQDESDDSSATVTLVAVVAVVALPDVS